MTIGMLCRFASAAAPTSLPATWGHRSSARRRRFFGTSRFSGALMTSSMPNVAGACALHFMAGLVSSTFFHFDIVDR